jgi:hypothetical protein
VFCGSEKNYRLQDIQLSKIRLAAFGSFGATGSRCFASPVNLNVSAALLGCLAVASTAFIGAKAGGEYRARTGDLLVANQALSQLS